MAKRIDFVIFRMKLRGTTISDWAKEHGYKRDTVFKTIRGERGAVTGGRGYRGDGLSARIKAELKEEGFWPSDDEIEAAVNG